MKTFKKGCKEKLFMYKPGNIQTTLMVAFSVISAVIMLCMGSVMYLRFSSMSRQEILENNQKLMDQTIESVEDYLINMRQISDALYYDIIKESDISSQSDKIHSGMNLLYEANKENLRSIAIYNKSGSLMEAEPVVAQKEDPNVTKQEWFMHAMNQMENIHFSTPHVQNLFDDGSCRYYWVISSSRVVELTNGSNTQLGVLLVDMDYSGIARMMDRINTAGSGQYFYLCDSNGQIIYHPHQVQLDNGMKNESSKKAATAKESVYEEIKDKFGMDVVRFRRKSDGMTLIQSDIDEALKRVCLIYSNEETIMEYQMIFNYKEQSHGYDVEDKKIKEEQMIVDGNKINIIQYELSDGSKENIAQFEYKDVFYILNTTMEEEEFKKILKNLYFF